jgi:hypothetical protein
MTFMRTDLPIARLHNQSGITSRFHFGDLHMTTREEQNYRDNENAIGVWLEHGIQGTQPAPNKNGGK